jgi:hemoglobin
MPDINNHYDRIGGEAGVRKLVQRFYELMDTLPEAYEIRKLHAPDLGQAENKLFMFLSGWMGGPPLYEEAFGHPRLRMRHLPFAIGTRERDQWMLCMEQAMQDTGVEPELAEELKSAFYRVADFMRNQEG